MGNRTHLLIRKASDRYEVIFEGNNSLAAFWLMLLDRDVLESIRPAYRSLYAENVGQVDTDIRVNKDIAIARARMRRRYMEQVYPRMLSFYDDWVNYINSLESSDNALYIDLVEMAGFYLNPDVFIDSLLDFFTDIEQNNPVLDLTIPGTSGWEYSGHNAFATFSAAYRSFPEIRNLYKQGNQGKKIAAEPRTLFKYTMLQYGWGVLAIAALISFFYGFCCTSNTWQRIWLTLLLAPVLFIIIVGFAKLDSLKRKQTEEMAGENSHI